VLDLCPGGVVRDGKSRGEFAPPSGECQYRGDVRHGGRDKGDQTLIDEFDFYVGIDLAAERHQACLLNRTGKVIGELAFEHSGIGLIAFIRFLEKLTCSLGNRVGVALEMPRGPVIECLMERGYVVFSLNPKQLDRFRDRHTVAGAKDDRRDAFVLADSLRTDLALFKRLQQESATVIRLRELSRLEDDLIQDHNRIINRLREQLHRYFPQLLQLSPAAEDAWIWDLLEIGPVPARASKLTRARVERILKRHRIRRLTVDEVMLALKAPALKVAPGSAEAASEHALLLIPRLRLIRDQRLAVASRMESLLEELSAPAIETIEQPAQPSDAAVIRSLPGVGRVVAAILLAEASQAITERDYQALRSYAGVAPVTKQSGQKRTVAMRRGCNNRLRNAFYHWCRVTIMCDERSRVHYSKLRSHGHSHGRALRTLADRWLTVLMAMLTKHRLFDAVEWNGDLGKSTSGELATTLVG
jgi:transposase